MATIVDPRGQIHKESAAASLSSRPGTLDGKVVALLDNGKWNTGPLLDKVAELIRGKYQVGDILRFRTHFSRPSRPELIQELIARSDVVINGSGD